MNPLLPTPLDGTLTIAMSVAMIVSLIAMVSVLRARSVSGSRAMRWLLVVLFVPFIGPAAWFLARYRARALERRVTVRR